MAARPNRGRIWHAGGGRSRGVDRQGICRDNLYGDADVDAVTKPARALAIARVGLGTGGTAFAISDDLALTAFHVVGDRRTGIIKQSEPQLVFNDGTVTATVDPRTAPAADAALLHLREPIPSGYVPVALVSEIFGDRWFSRGFPTNDPTATGVTIDGNVVDPDQRQPQSGASVIALYCQQAAAGSPQQLIGFSGAPVIMASQSGAVGLIRWNPTNPNMPGFAAGGTVYACPVRSICARWPELRDFVGAVKSAPDDAKESGHLERLISQQERNLRITEMQASKYAPAELPLHLANQIEDIKNELSSLRKRLRADSDHQPL